LFTVIIQINTHEKVLLINVWRMRLPVPVRLRIDGNVIQNRVYHGPHPGRNDWNSDLDISFQLEAAWQIFSRCQNALRRFLGRVTVHWPRLRAFDYNFAAFISLVVQHLGFPGFFHAQHARNNRADNTVIDPFRYLFQIYRDQHQI
jgi:hypothetical protein